MTRWRSRIAVAAILLLARSASGQDRPGSVVGFVEDRQGAPVSGALVSVFGKALAGGSLIAISDSSGRFQLPQLPAGSYTLRAVTGEGLVAPPRMVTVLPDHHSLFTLSLLAADAATEALLPVATDQERKDAAREWKWLVQHKRRSVLETEQSDASGARPDLAPHQTDLLGQLPSIEGTLEVMASSSALDELAGGALPAGVGSVKLSGGLGDSGRWALGGLLAESESNTWRMAAEFMLEPGQGHQLQIGSGYGSRYILPLSPAATADERFDSRSVGTIFVEDRWSLDDRSTATFGARYAFVGFVGDRHHVDPSGSFEFRPDHRLALSAGVRGRTLVPGGDLLTLSTLSATPAIAYALLADDLRAEKVLRYDLGARTRLGHFTLEARGFQESSRDRLVNVFSGFGSDRTLRIVNGPGALARGAGIGVSRRFGNALRASLDYAFGVSQRREAGPALLVTVPSGQFHDLVARLETAIARSDTRVTIYYRVNATRPRTETAVALPARTSTRFDLQLSQGLPFLGTLTRADWDLLFAFRNVFYEPTEGGFLDELAVVQPPRRMLGGVAVRF